MLSAHSITNENPNTFIISRTEIKSAIDKLKANKTDGEQQLWSDHIKLARNVIAIHIARLMTAMLIHGYSCKELSIATINSLIKNPHADKCSSDNYRGISLCSCITKLYDIVLLKQYEHCFVTSELQYAFKKQHSTNMCTLMLKDVVSYHLYRNTNVYSCFIDASKAFDRVKYDKLFETLINRGVPYTVIRLLMEQYTHQKICTKWGHATSAYFSASNGIKQGSVASPILFTVYIDELLQRLEKSKIGCHVGHEYFGALGYADDLTLLCPSITGLQSMVDICTTFAKEFDIKFNPDKSVCLAFTKYQLGTRDYNITIDGKKLKWQNNVLYLGNYLNSDLNDDMDIHKKKCVFIGRSNQVITDFRSIQRNICSRLFNTYCCYYNGAEAWDLRNKSLNGINVAWNKAIRRIWGLPRNSRTFMLPSIGENVPPIDAIIKRVYRLIVQNNSYNSKFMYLLKNAKFDSRSLIGTNMRVACHFRQRDSVSGDRVWRVCVARELCRALSDTERVYVEGFDDAELNEILDYVSTL